MRPLGVHQELGQRTVRFIDFGESVNFDSLGGT
jgi:hypothetical protein